MPSKYASLSVGRSSVDEIRGAVMRYDGLRYIYRLIRVKPCFSYHYPIVSSCPHSVNCPHPHVPLADYQQLKHHNQPTLPTFNMSDLTAKVTKDSKGSIVVEGYEALKYNFHFDTPVFDTKHGKLAEIYERWKRVLIVIDTSESLLSLIQHARGLEVDPVAGIVGEE
jgi:hypothetical protein